jgi:hypothetical protein
VEVQERRPKLLLRLNNQQLLNLSSTGSLSVISFSLLIVDLNKQEHSIPLTLLSLKLLTESMVECDFEIQHQSSLIFIIKELRIRIGPLLCYYVNKSIELQEMKQMEASSPTKRKTRKYSFLEEKLKEEEFIHMLNKSEELALSYLYYHVRIVLFRPTASLRRRKKGSSGSLWN